MRCQPKVTVALLTYNRPQYLSKAIQAILQQTYSEFEFLICDNGSGEETQKIISRFSDERIVVIRNDVNERSFYNVPFHKATGDYLLITHDDDIMHPDFLEKEVKVLDSDANIVAVGCNIAYIDEEDQVLTAARFHLPQDFVYHQYAFLDLYIKGQFLYCPTVLMRRQFFVQNHLEFDFRIGPGTDIFLWHKVSEFPVKMCMVKDVLYKYRKHTHQDSSMNHFVNQEMLHHHLLSDTQGKPVFNRARTKIIMQLLYDNYAMLKQGLISPAEYRRKQAAVKEAYRPGWYVFIRLLLFQLKLNWTTPPASLPAGKRQKRLASHDGKQVNQETSLAK